MQLTIVNATQPFVVTSPNGGENTSGTTTVTWNVAATNVAPLFAPNVDIFLSVDGGLTYPTTLVTATPNDGSHALVMPNSATTSARIMVKGSNHVFFDVSDINSTITAGGPVERPPGMVTLASPIGTIASQTPNYTWMSVEANPDTVRFNDRLVLLDNGIKIAKQSRLMPAMKTASPNQRSSTKADTRSATAQVLAYGRPVGQKSAVLSTACPTHDDRRA